MQGGYKQIQKVQDFLLDVSIYDHLEALIQKYNIPSDRLEELLDLTDAVMKGAIQISQMPVMLGQAFGLDEQVSKQVACDLLGYRLLPLADFIPEVEDSIKIWGGDIGLYPKLRIKKPEVDDEIVGFAKDIGLDLPDHLMKRFIFLSRGYINKERDRDATLVLLKRPITIGGLEMNDQQINRLLEMLDTKFRVSISDSDNKYESPIVAVDSEEVSIAESKNDENISPVAVVNGDQGKKITRSREILPIKAVPMALTTDVPVVSGSIMHDDEEHEIVQYKKKLENIISADDQHLQIQEEIIENTAKAIFGYFKDARQTQQSARELSRSYVKGLIDAQRAHVILIDKYLIDQNNALLVLKALQHGYDQFNNNKSVVKKVVKQTRAIIQNEASLLDSRHAALTGTVPKESIQSVLPNAKVSASRSKEEEIVISKSKISSEALKGAQEKSRPAKATVLLSSQSIAPKNKQDVAAKVTDIAYSQKLVGPIEELGTMGIVEFRRLSSDPMEAARKVLGLLDLLESDDYEQRVRGVQAWRKSPLQNLYISLTQESLMRSMAITDIASSRRNKGEMTLSASEIDAIVEINNRIKF